MWTNRQNQVNVLFYFTFLVINNKLNKHNRRRKTTRMKNYFYLRANTGYSLPTSVTLFTQFNKYVWLTWHTGFMWLIYKCMKTFSFLQSMWWVWLVEFNKEKKKKHKKHPHHISVWFSWQKKEGRIDRASFCRINKITIIRCLGIYNISSTLIETASRKYLYGI